VNKALGNQLIEVQPDNKTFTITEEQAKDLFDSIYQSQNEDYPTKLSYFKN